MSWEKIGVTTVGKPVSHGSGLYLRVRKDLVEAYKLWDAEMVEFTIDRVKRPAAGESETFLKVSTPRKKRGRRG